MNLTHTCRSIALAGHRLQDSSSRAADPSDVEIITNGLRNPESKVRVIAFSAAERAGILGVEQLTGALDDPHPDVRYRALELISHRDAEQGLTDRVIAALADPELTELAAFVLGELAPAAEAGERAVSALQAIASDHEDALCRESAVAALGAIGAETGLATILDATTDVATVRRRAIIALAAFDGGEVDAALQRALTDRDWQVRQAAEDLLEPTTEQ